MNRFPTLHRDPTMPVASAASASASTGRHLSEIDSGVPTSVPHTAVPHSDRLEVVRTEVTRARHRRPLDPRPTRRPGARTWLALGILVVAGLIALAAHLQVRVPSPVAAGLTVAALPLVGLGPLRVLRRSTGLDLPDPLTRLVVRAALGLVLLTALLRLADLAGLTPGPAVLAVGLGILALLPCVLRPEPTGPLRRPRREDLLLLPLVALPVLGWIDVSAGPTSPGWLRFAVLVAGLGLLGRAALRRTARPRRTEVAATLYALAVAVLTPLGTPASNHASNVPWTSTLAALFTLEVDRVERVVLPAVAALVVVAAWLAGERVLGPVRAVAVGTLVLAVLVAAPPGWADLAVAAAALVVLGARGARARRPLAGRRVLVVVLTAGALLLAPTATVFAAQVCLVALVSLALGRPRTHVLTLPVALGLAVAVWIATSLRGDLSFGAGPVPLAAVVVIALAALGLVWGLSAALVGRDRPARQDTEFLLLVAAGLLVQAVATAASPGTSAGTSSSYVPHVALLATVPAVLGVAGVWAALSTAGGAALDRVPGRWLRTSAQATRGHRRAPLRLTRTALVALALFAVEYARRAFN